MPSLLSALRANTRPVTYRPNTMQSKDNTTKLPVSPNRPISANTFSKSIGFDATKKSPPKADR